MRALRFGSFSGLGSCVACCSGSLSDSAASELLSFRFFFAGLALSFFFRFTVSSSSSLPDSLEDLRLFLFSSSFFCLFFCFFFSFFSSCFSFFLSFLCFFDTSSSGSDWSELDSFLDFFFLSFLTGLSLLDDDLCLLFLSFSCFSFFFLRSFFFTTLSSDADDALTLDSLSFLDRLLSRLSFTGEDGLLLSLSRLSRTLFLLSAESLRLFLLRESSRPEDPDLLLLAGRSLLLDL